MRELSTLSKEGKTSKESVTPDDSDGKKIWRKKVLFKELCLHKFVKARSQVFVVQSHLKDEAVVTPSSIVHNNFPHKTGP